MKLFHKHKWVQVKDITGVDKETKSKVIYLFCERCHDICGVGLNNCPQWKYPEKKEMEGK